MLQTTVMLKTDWERSTERVRRLSDVDLTSQLSEHKAIMSKIVQDYQGRIIKGEGDAFWVSFPSVTSAVHAASAMQYEVRFVQTGLPDGERLAMRIGIAVGDLLHKDGDVFGSAMSLTQRIESIALRDEIYLSHAAWLILNHAEIQTAFVGSFKLKGFDHEEQVYRVVQRPNIRIETDEIVVITDIRGYTSFMRQAPMEEIAQCFNDYEAIAQEVASRFGGRLRVMAGDTHILSFENPAHLFDAIEAHTAAWRDFRWYREYSMSLTIGAHVGEIYTYRAHLFGEVINATHALMEFASAALLPDDAAVLVLSEKLRARMSDISSRGLEAYLSDNERLLNRFPEAEREFYCKHFKA